ncbi:hypothetical protein HK101_009635 [Irineochytrium annulatum]|nr:hypothetical protein HK101_009635 [Irineochytrium annulatum]
MIPPRPSHQPHHPFDGGDIRNDMEDEDMVNGDATRRGSNGTLSTAVGDGSSLPSGTGNMMMTEDPKNRRLSSPHMSFKIEDNSSSSASLRVGSWNAGGTLIGSPDFDTRTATDLTFMPPHHRQSFSSNSSNSPTTSLDDASPRFTLLQNVPVEGSMTPSALLPVSEIRLNDRDHTPLATLALDSLAERSRALSDPLPRIPEGEPAVHHRGASSLTYFGDHTASMLAAANNRPRANSNVSVASGVSSSSSALSDGAGGHNVGTPGGDDYGEDGSVPPVGVLGSGAGSKGKAITGKVPKTYLCPVESCGKQFGRSSHLSRHYKSTHTQPFAFKCPVPSCPKRFSRSDILKKHSKVHLAQNGGDPFNGSTTAAMDTAVPQPDLFSAEAFINMTPPSLPKPSKTRAVPLSLPLPVPTPQSRMDISPIDPPSRPPLPPSSNPSHNNEPFALPPKIITASSLPDRYNPSPSAASPQPQFAYPSPTAAPLISPATAVYPSVTANARFQSASNSSGATSQFHQPQPQPIPSQPPASQHSMAVRFPEQPGVGQHQPSPSMPMAIPGWPSGGYRHQQQHQQQPEPKIVPAPPEARASLLLLQPPRAGGSLQYHTHKLPAGSGGGTSFAAVEQPRAQPAGGATGVFGDLLGSRGEDTAGSPGAGSFGAVRVGSVEDGVGRLHHGHSLLARRRSADVNGGGGLSLSLQTNFPYARPQPGLSSSSSNAGSLGLASPLEQIMISASAPSSGGMGTFSHQFGGLVDGGGGDGEVGFGPSRKQQMQERMQMQQFQQQNQQQGQQGQYHRMSFDAGAGAGAQQQQSHPQQLYQNQQHQQHQQQQQQQNQHDLAKSWGPTLSVAPSLASSAVAPGLNPSVHTRSRRRRSDADAGQGPDPRGASLASPQQPWDPVAGKQAASGNGAVGGFAGGRAPQSLLSDRIQQQRMMQGMAGPQAQPQVFFGHLAGGGEEAGR